MTTYTLGHQLLAHLGPANIAIMTEAVGGECTIGVTTPAQTDHAGRVIAAEFTLRAGMLVTLSWSGPAMWFVVTELGERAYPSYEEAKAFCLSLFLI